MTNDEQDLPAILDWSHELAQLPAKRAAADLAVERAAQGDELAAITKALGVLACRALKVSYTISARAKRRYVMQGQLHSVVEQACVVSLDPVTETIEEQFDVTFWPADQILEAEQLQDARAAKAEAETGADDEVGEDDLQELDIEPLGDGVLEAGRVIYEVLAGGLALYPRAEGVVFEPEQIGAAEQVERENPFAALADLKSKDS